VNYDETAQLQVVEQQVDVEVVIADFQVKLAADEGEALPQLQQETLQVVEETRLQLPLVEGCFEGQQVEDVRVFERLPREVGLRRGQQPLEVRQGLSMPAMGLRLDHGEQDVEAPAVGERLLHVPEEGRGFLDALHEQHVVCPGDLGNQLLPIWDSGQ